MSLVDFIDNSAAMEAAFDAALAVGLEKCGLAAEKYAKKLCKVVTGNLRNSISHKVDTVEHAAYIGTNVEYAPYVELGTGIYAEDGGGRPTGWAYIDAKGIVHYHHGQKPQPYLKPAVADHAEEYRGYIKSALQGK